MKVSASGQVFEHSLDFRAAKALRTLIIDGCRFNLHDAEPWILSDAGLRDLRIHVEEDNTNTLETVLTIGAGPFSTNIFSAINLSNLSVFSLTLRSPGSETISYLFPKQQWRVHSGLERCLHSLELVNVDYEMAVALGDAGVFPSLRSCLMLFDGQTASNNAQSLVDLLCTFLSRQTSLLVLRFGLSWPEFFRKGSIKFIETVKKFDLALCSGTFACSLRPLRNLRSLNLISFDFSVNLIPPPLANPEIFTRDLSQCFIKLRNRQCLPSLSYLFKSPNLKSFSC